MATRFKYLFLCVVLFCRKIGGAYTLLQCLSLTPTLYSPGLICSAALCRPLQQLTIPKSYALNVNSWLPVLQLGSPETIIHRVYILCRRSQKQKFRVCLFNGRRQQFWEQRACAVSDAFPVSYDWLTSGGWKTMVSVFSNNDPVRVRHSTNRSAYTGTRITKA